MTALEEHLGEKPEIYQVMEKRAKSAKGSKRELVRDCREMRFKMCK